MLQVQHRLIAKLGQHPLPSLVKKNLMLSFRFVPFFKGSMLALMLSLWLVFSPQLFHSIALAESQSTNDLQKQQQVIEDYRSNVSKQRQQIQDLEGAARNRLGGLERKIQVTETHLQTYETQIKQATEKLKGLEIQLAKAQTAYQTKQDNTADRLRFLQRQQDNSEWATLLQSKTLEQLLERRHRLRRVYESERQTLMSLKTERDRVNERKLQVETQKNQISLLSQQLLDQKSEYKAEAEVQSDLVGRLTSDRQALEAAETQLAEDSRKLAMIIRDRTAPSGTSPRRSRSGITRFGTSRLFGTGRMRQPSNGPITSNFGWRQHPILGTGRFHAGTDFGAEHGSPINAADSGTVIFAGWYGGYGNAVIIDHGNGLTSLYGHASELYVVEGQTVRQGQLIAAVGSTGLSTGPHLHFEVRKNGEPTDPLAFL